MVPLFLEGFSSCSTSVLQQVSAKGRVLASAAEQTDWGPLLMKDPDTHLHGDAEVHHGHAGVAVPADVHRGVSSWTLALQGGAQAAQLLLLLLRSVV